MPSLDSITLDGSGNYDAIVAYVEEASASSNIQAVVDLIDKCSHAQSGVFWNDTKVMGAIVNSLEGSKFGAKDLELLLPKMNARKNIEQHAARLGIHLSGVYEAAGDTDNAASVLSEALQHYKLEGGSHEVWELDLYYKCAGFHAQRGDIGECAKLLAQARGMKGRAERHRQTHAMLQGLVNQHYGKFLVAARGYLKVAAVDENAIRTGAICAILGLGEDVRGGAAGSVDRHSVLLDFAKDPRTQSLDIYPYLQKALSGYLFRKTDVDGFMGMLEPHQAAHFKNAALPEHNILAVSKLYDNISLEQLGLILEVSKDEAEKAASSIISEGRLDASIDQSTDVLSFGSHDDEFNDAIRDTCKAVQEIVVEINKGC
jgi:COP9 signalosome complex subunit 4